MAAGFEPRLFQATNRHGYFHVEEIYNFGQEDLINDDIMLLDTYSTIYVWIGNRSNDFEKRGAFKAAAAYLNSVNDGRDKAEVQIVDVQAGKEPPMFTSYFPQWRLDKAQKWLDENPVKLMEGKLLKGVTVKMEEVKKDEGKYLDPTVQKFPYE